MPYIGLLVYWFHTLKFSFEVDEWVHNAEVPMRSAHPPQGIRPIDLVCIHMTLLMSNQTFGLICRHMQYDQDAIYIYSITDLNYSV